jgi:choline dehydrogenase-like flavoprotein
MNDRHYDVLIIGTGAGGGTLAHRLADSGKRVLMLERGGFLPREKANWDTVEVFQKDRYHTNEVWFDKDGAPLHPGTGYWVGGNTKVYGAALLRLRERDFEVVPHHDGVSPAWPISYAELAPYYDQAEALYAVHGEAGVDPTEPPRRNGFPFPKVSHEPRIQEICERLRELGHRPFHLPLGVRLNEDDQHASACIRCDTCDGFPCLVDAKADSDTSCVRPALRQGVELITHAHVQRLHTDSTGRQVTAVEALVGPGPHPERVTFRADVVVVACGAINSAVLLLRSANDRHPNGLANGSDQVGRNFMKHHNGAILGLSQQKNPTVFQKTLGCNDFYWGEPGFDYPMGHVQLLGKVNKDMLAADAPSFAPGLALETMAERAVAWWLTAEDLPLPQNRVRVEGAGGERIVLEYHDHNTAGFDRLLTRWQAVLRSVDSGQSFIPHGLYFRKKIPLQAVGHQCGTARFGRDPATSVLDVDCRAHELDNLYVVDGSFFPSSAAVNPSLTIMANALRVGDHLRARLG